MVRRIQKKMKRSLKTKKILYAVFLPFLMMFIANFYTIHKYLIWFTMWIDEWFLKLLGIPFYSGTNFIVVLKDSNLLKIYFTKDCIGITPLSLMLSLILISNSKTQRSYFLISILLLFSTFIFNMIRIVAETYFYLKNPENSDYVELMLFPVTNILYVFLVWLFMLQRKYIYIDIWQRKD